MNHKEAIRKQFEKTIPKICGKYNIETDSYGNNLDDLLWQVFVTAWMESYKHHDKQTQETFRMLATIL